MIGIEIEAEGLEVVNELIEFSRSFLDACGNLVTGCGLHVKPRLDGPEGLADSDNVTIANSLIEYERDFFSLNDWEAGEVAAMFARVVQAQLDTIAKRNIRAAGKGLKGAVQVSAMMKAAEAGTGAIGSQAATQVAGKAYKEAMAKWMHIVSDRISNQKTVYGGSPKPLSEMYAEEKQKDVGFTIPIGVRTGQLRENFDPSNTGNIRLYRDKSTHDQLMAGIKRFL